MINKERVIKTVFRAVDEINELSPKEQQLEKTLNTALFGNLDSLGFVTFIVAVEQKVEEDFGVTIMLTGENGMSGENNPFQTIETLVSHVLMLSEEKLNG